MWPMHPVEHSRQHLPQGQGRWAQGNVNRSLSDKGREKNEFCNTKPSKQINNRSTGITRKIPTQRTDKGVVGGVTVFFILIVVGAPGPCMFLNTRGTVR